MHKDVHRVHQLGYPRRWHQPGQDEAILQLHLCDPSLKLSAQQAVADPEEANARELRAQLRRDVEQIFVALEIKQSCDRADCDVSVTQTELFASLCTRQRGI